MNVIPYSINPLVEQKGTLELIDYPEVIAIFVCTTDDNKGLISTKVSETNTNFKIPTDNVDTNIVFDCNVANTENMRKIFGREIIAPLVDVEFFEEYYLYKNSVKRSPVPYMPFSVHFNDISDNLHTSSLTSYEWLNLDDVEKRLKYLLPEASKLPHLLTLRRYFRLFD